MSFLAIIAVFCLAVVFCGSAIAQLLEFFTDGGFDDDDWG